MSTFTWNGQELGTIGKLLDAVTEIADREDTADAQDFMSAYREFTSAADENVGYIAGYCDSETAKRIWRVFGTVHPVFGTKIPTPEEAFAAGVAMGEKMREEAQQS